MSSGQPPSAVPAPAGAAADKIAGYCQNAFPSSLPVYRVPKGWWWQGHLLMKDNAAAANSAFEEIFGPSFYAEQDPIIAMCFVHVLWWLKKRDNAAFVDRVKNEQRIRHDLRVIAANCPFPGLITRLLQLACE
eukprot:2462497-Rhodomonas_salina.1